MKLNSVVHSYLKDCSVALRPATVDAYRFALLRLVRHLERRQVELLRSVTADDIRDFLDAMQKTGAAQVEHYKPATIHQFYRSVRTFFTWCHKAGLVRVNPMLLVRPPNLPHPVPYFLSADQLQQMLDTCEFWSEEKERNRALLMLLIDTGLRRAEVVQLLPEDFLPREKVLIVRIGKMSKGRVVPLSPRTIYELSQWLVARPDELASLFGMTAAAVHMLFVRLSHHLGWRVYPHALRHTFATLYEGDVQDVQQILGHADASTTAMLYRHRNIRNLVSQHEASSPIAKLGEIGGSHAAKAK